MKTTIISVHATDGEKFYSASVYTVESRNMELEYNGANP